MSGTCKLFSLAVGHDLAVFAALLKNALHDTLNWPLRVFRSLCSGYAGSAAHRTHTAAAIEYSVRRRSKVSRLHSQDPSRHLRGHPTNQTRPAAARLAWVGALRQRPTSALHSI